MVDQPDLSIASKPDAISRTGDVLYLLSLDDPKSVDDCGYELTYWVLSVEIRSGLNGAGIQQ